MVEIICILCVTSRVFIFMVPSTIQLSINFVWKNLFMWEKKIQKIRRIFTGYSVNIRWNFFNIRLINRWKFLISVQPDIQWIFGRYYSTDTTSTSQWYELSEKEDGGNILNNDFDFLFFAFKIYFLWKINVICKNYFITK